MMRNPVFVALLLVILTVVTRLPSLLHPQPIDDEAVYSVVANEIVDGGRPYVDAVERKPPFLFWTYAAIFKRAGKFNWKALHSVALVWTLGTMAGLYVIGQTLFDPETGLTAALFYSIFQPWLTSKDLAFNGELLMNLPIVWAWAIAFDGQGRRLRLELFIAGALLCAGFLLKQPAAIAVAPLVIYLLLPSYRQSRSFHASVLQVTMLAAGFLGTLAAVTFALRKHGILGEAFYWTITNHDIPQVFWDRAAVFTLAFATTCAPLLIGAWMAYRNADDVWGNRIPERKALLLLLAASCLGAAASGRFYDHYYIQLIPPLALLSAPHYVQFWSRKTRPPFWLLKPAVTYTWLALIVAGFSFEHWRELASQRDSTETGRYLAEHSTPDDKIFVWGQEPKIYLDARRRPASRYIATFPLTGYIFGSFTGTDTRNRIMPGAWSTLQDDFRKHPPAYIVDVQVGPHNAQYPVRNFPILATLLKEQYQPVAWTAEGVVYQRSQLRSR